MCISKWEIDSIRNQAAVELKTGAIAHSKGQHYLHYAIIRTTCEVIHRQNSVVQFLMTSAVFY